VKRINLEEKPEFFLSFQVLTRRKATAKKKNSALPARARARRANTQQSFFPFLFCVQILVKQKTI